MEITELLRQVREGDRVAKDVLFAAVYSELRRLAAGQRRRRSASDTLNTTALVHEAYLKLVGNELASWNDRGHFFAVAAIAMRHILVDYAERRRAAKRGGGRPEVSLDDANPVAPEAAREILDLHEALGRLESEHPRQARVVECRFFAGLGVEETAQALDVSPATVKRDWAMARIWLGEALGAES